MFDYYKINVGAAGRFTPIYLDDAGRYTLVHQNLIFANFNTTINITPPLGNHYLQPKDRLLKAAALRRVFPINYNKTKTYNLFDTSGNLVAILLKAQVETLFPDFDLENPLPSPFSDARGDTLRDGDLVITNFGSRLYVGRDFSTASWAAFSTLGDVVFELTPEVISRLSIKIYSGAA